MTGIVVLAALLALTMAPGPARAQSELGEVFDILSGVLGGEERGRISGHVVFVEDRTMVFRTTDGRTVKIDVSALDPGALAGLQSGDQATVSARSTGSPGRLAATGVQRTGTGGAAGFHRLEGTIERVSGSRVHFRTDAGLVLTLDVSRIAGLEPLREGEQATLFYEQRAPRQQVVAVWVEPGTDAALGAASPGTSAPGPSGAPWPSAATPTTDRVQGRVDSVSLSSLTLRTFEGRNVLVDLSRIDPGIRQVIRPGDVVTAFGERGQPGTFVASWIERRAIQ